MTTAACDCQASALPVWRRGVVVNAVITIAIRHDTTTIRLRSDYDVSRAPASNSTQEKRNMSIFRRIYIAVESNA